MLFQFTIHSDLGRVVQAIIREFERSPPPIIGEKTAVTASTVQPRGMKSCHKYYLQKMYLFVH